MHPSTHPALCPLNATDVARCVIQTQDTARRVGRPVPRVIGVPLAPGNQGVTAEEFRYLVADTDAGWRWRHAGSPWALACQAARLKAQADPLEPSPPTPARRRGGGAVVDATRRRLHIGGQVFTVPAPDGRDFSVNMGDPRPVVHAETGGRGYPAWMGALFQGDGAGSAVVPAEMTDKTVPQITSRSPWVDGPTETATLFLCREALLDGVWPIVPVGRTLSAPLVLGSRVVDVRVTTEGLLVGATALRTNCGVTAQLRMGREDVMAAAAMADEDVLADLNCRYTAVCETQLVGIAILATPACSVVSTSTLRETRDWARSAARHDGITAVPVITAGHTLDNLVVLCHPDRRDAVVVRRQDVNEEEPVYFGRLVLGSPLARRPLFATCNGGNFVVATHATNQPLEIHHARRDVDLWLRRSRALDPIGRGPLVHGVYASSAFRVAGGGSVTVAVLLDEDDVPRDTGTPTVSAAVRSLLAGLGQGTGGAAVRIVHGKWEPDDAWPIPGLWRLVHALHETGACREPKHVAVEDTGTLVPTGDPELLLFCDARDYSAFVVRALDAGHQWIPVESQFLRGAGRVQHSPVPLALLHSPATVPGAPRPDPGYEVSGYEGCSVSVLLMESDPTQVVGFVLGGYAPPCWAPGLTTEDLVAFLARLGRHAECVYAVDSLVLGDAGTDDPDLPRLIAALVSGENKRGAIVDVGGNDPVLATQPRDTGGALGYVVAGGIPRTNQNTTALAEVLGCDPGALPLLLSAPV